MPNGACGLRLDCERISRPLEMDVIDDAADGGGVIFLNDITLYCYLLFIVVRSLPLTSTICHGLVVCGGEREGVEVFSWRAVWASR